MKLSPPPGKHVVAVLLASVAALIARAWLQIELARAGYDAALAGDLAYFVVPPILLLLLFPVLSRDRVFVRAQFRREDLTVGVVLFAVAIGILVRIARHAQIVAGVAFGVTSFDAPTVNQAAIALDCPPASLILLSLVVYAGLVPLIEELAHRAYVQSYFARFGPLAAILISTAVFVAFHRSAGWSFVALGGIVLGICYWLTASLWLPVVLHAVLNLLPHVTLRCFDIRWNPDTSEGPAWFAGVVAASVAGVSLAATAALLFVLWRRRAAAGPAPGASQRERDTLDDV